ncbi:MAG: hypothetical protein II998_09465 [Clostridia bacterium]|nr:hypothetical protein [Clostridia bacterium]
MTVKKFLCVVLSFVMVCCALINVSAEESLCDKVGIPEDLSSHVLVKFDGNETSANPTTIANTQIINLGDSIGMFSSPWNSYYKITANSGRAAILNSTNIYMSGQDAVTSKGYQLYCISADGTSNGLATVENNGWIMAIGEHDTVNIPIVDSFELAYTDGDSIGISNFPSGVTANTKAVGGKAFDDNSIEFVVAPGAVLNSANPARVVFNKVKTLNSPKTVVTAEFSVRVTGDAVAYVERNGGIKLFELTSDGIFKYKSYDKGVNVEEKVCDDASQWHNVAITYDYAGNRIVYYFDGVKLAATGNLTSSADLTEVRLCVKSQEYVEGGSVAYDDFVLRRGYYTGAGTQLNVKNLAENIAVDTNAKKIYYNSDDIDVTAVCDEITASTDASKASAYTDASLTESATGNIQPSNVIVVKTADKIHYETYTVEKRSNELVVISENGMIKATQLYNNGSDNLIIAEYDSERTCLTNIKVESGVESVEIKDNTASGCTYKAFLWDDMDNIRPVLASLAYPSK